MDARIKIITPTYNCEKWVEKCITSVKSQSSASWEQIFVDDGSTDKTMEILTEQTKDDKRFKIVSKDQRMGVMHSHITGTELLLREASADSIIMHLDGDDWLSSPYALERIVNAYDTSGCLATYGNYEATDGSPSICREKYPELTIREHIKRQWCFSHIRTFKKLLWDKILVGSLLDTNGIMFSSACDVAIFCPVLEMAGDRVTFIDNPMYTYNRENPLNEDKHHLEDQVRCALEIAQMPPYEVLDV